MPVRIPAAPGLAAQQTPRMEVRGSSAGDMGLGALADALKQGAQAYTEAEGAKADAAYTQAQTTFEQGYIPAARAYDGSQAGFAKGQIASRDQVFDKGAQGLSEEARRRYDQLNLQHRVQAVGAATEVEAAGQAHVVERQRSADTAARNAGVLASSLVDTQTQLDDAFRADPTSPSFVADNLARIDARHQAMIAGAPEQDRPALQVQLASQRADAQLSLASAGRHLLDARIAGNTKTAIDTLRNGVEANPGLLSKALETFPHLVAGLPVDAREQANREGPGALYMSALNGMAAHEDWHGMDGLLARREVKATVPPDAYATYRTRVVGELTSASRQLSSAATADRLQSEIASVRLTGKTTGFDPSAAAIAAFGPVAGPAKALEWKQAVADAQLVHQAVGDAATLPAVDLEKRLTQLKPAGGEADFARRQAIYEGAVQVAQQLVTQRAADPAAAIQADKATAAAWRAAEAGSPEDAVAWAAGALRRQAALGIPTDAQRVLPVAEAKRLIASVSHAQGPEHRQALLGVAAYAGRFGEAGGQVLRELGQNGMDRTDLAVLAEVGADPIVVGAYARGRDRSGALKLDKGQEKPLGDAVERQLKPLAASYAVSDGGAEHADALRDATLAMAKGFMADGDNAQTAAQKAARMFTERFAFDRSGWRMPAALAAQAATVTERNRIYAGGASIDQDRTRTGTALDAVRLGAERLLGDAVAAGGAGLRAAGAEPNLTEAQKRARFADVVADRGRWVTAADGGGLRLVFPDPRGGMADVLDKDGKPIVRSFSELQARAASILPKGR